MSHLLDKELDEVLSKDDLTELDKFTKIHFEKLNEIQKQKIIDGYENIYNVCLMDLFCQKYAKEDELAVAEVLLQIACFIEKLDSRKDASLLKANIYEVLADLNSDDRKKIENLDKAISEFKKTKSDYMIANALQKKLFIQKKYQGHEILNILSYLKKSLQNYSESALRSFIFNSYELLSYLPLALAEHYFKIFSQSIDEIMQTHIFTNPILSLDWSINLRSVLDSKLYNLSLKQQFLILEKSNNLLKSLDELETTNKNVLDQLGKNFHSAALSLNLKIEEKIYFYENAVKFFKQAQEINPAAWTYPTYSTNVLKELAQIYIAEKNLLKATETFERGISIFNRSSKFVDDDFTFNLNWGQYCLDYNKIIYDFHNAELLVVAKKKFLIAKEYGNNYYTTPFIGLAKVALKLNQESECLDLLSTCKSIFAHMQYTLEDVKCDPDFQSIWSKI